MITAEHVKRLADEYALHFPNESAMQIRKELQDSINALCEQNALLMSDLIQTKRETWKKDKVIDWFKSWTDNQKVYNTAGITSYQYKQVVQRI
jgi:hypothetical protein